MVETSQGAGRQLHKDQSSYTTSFFPLCLTVYLTLCKMCVPSIAPIHSFFDTFINNYLLSAYNAQSYRLPLWAKQRKLKHRLPYRKFHLVEDRHGKISCLQSRKCVTRQVQINCNGNSKEFWKIGQWLWGRKVI